MWALTRIELGPSGGACGPSESTGLFLSTSYKSRKRIQPDKYIDHVQYVLLRVGVCDRAKESQHFHGAARGKYERTPQSLQLWERLTIMKTRFAIVICLALTASLAQVTSLAHWKSFKSSTGFFVKYPATWYSKGTSTDRLMILSSRGGAEAVVIKRGQAVISVKEEVQYADSTLSQVMGHYTQDTHVLSQKTIHNGNAGTHGCRDLREVVSREGAVPPEDVPGPVPYITNTEYFCEIERHKYVTVLRNFESDKKQAMYQQIALRMAESLRADE